jgi:hypothetical protein
MNLGVLYLFLIAMRNHLNISAEPKKKNLLAKPRPKKSKSRDSWKIWSPLTEYTEAISIQQKDPPRQRSIAGAHGLYVYCSSIDSTETEEYIR